MLFYLPDVPLRFSINLSLMGSILGEPLPMGSTPPRETFHLGPFTAPRIWTGLWQLSSNAWGSTSVSKVRSGMARYVEMGYTAFGERTLDAIISLVLTIPCRYGMFFHDFNAQVSSYCF